MNANHHLLDRASLRFAARAARSFDHDPVVHRRWLATVAELAARTGRPAPVVELVDEPDEDDDSDPRTASVQRPEFSSQHREPVAADSRWNPSEGDEPRRGEGAATSSPGDPSERL